MPAVISKVGQILTAPENASVIGAVPAATDLIGNAAWTTAAAALMPDVLPAAGTLLSAGGSRQLQAGSTVTHAGHFLMSPDNTYDIGANAATRPRTIYVGTSVLAPLFSNPAAAATTLGNATYGVTVPGAVTASKTGTISGTSVSPWLTVGSSGALSGSYDTAIRIIATDSGGGGSCLKWETSGGTTLWNAYNIGIYTLNIGPHAASGAAMFGFSYLGSNGTFQVGSVNGAYNGKFTAYSYDYAAITTTLHLINTENAGGGTQMLFGVGDSNGTVREGGWVRCDKSAQTAGTVTTDIIFGTTNAGTTASEVLRLGSSGLATFAGGIAASGLVSVGTYTVATLPAAGSNAGKMAQVTDSNVAASGNYGATVAAGGSNRVKVFSDGTNWVIA